jgi:hypothetical protein
MAFPRDGDRRGGPVRPAVIAAFFGVLGLVGAMPVDALVKARG